MKCHSTISLEYKAPFTHFFVCLCIYVLPCISGWPVTHYVDRLGGGSFFASRFCFASAEIESMCL